MGHLVQAIGIVYRIQGRIYIFQALYTYVHGGPPCRLSRPYKLYAAAVSRTGHSFSPQSVTHDRGKGGCKRTFSTLTLHSFPPPCNFFPVDCCSKQLMLYIQTFFPHYFTLQKRLNPQITKRLASNFHFERQARYRCTICTVVNPPLTVQFCFSITFLQ